MDLRGPGTKVDADGGAELRCAEEGGRHAGFQTGDARGHVVYTAHWDHLGIGPAVNGDRIYNGAVDNATGCAGLLEIARAFTKLSTPPKRSILFLSVTAEEQGLLGSQYYAAVMP